MTEKRLDLESLLPKSRLEKLQDKHHKFIRRLERLKRHIELIIEEMRGTKK